MTQLRRLATVLALSLSILAPSFAYAAQGGSFSYSPAPLMGQVSSLLSTIQRLASGQTAAVSDFVSQIGGLQQSAGQGRVLAAVANTMTLSDKSGASSTNYPFQFGRPFVQGEIANFPQVLINGTPAATQADVKNRWPDGSVKFAVLAVMIPSIPANGTVTLTFQNQTSGNNTALTSAQMLGTNYNFDAKIQISNGTQTFSASARQMLTDGKCTPWTSGQIAQTMLCADDSTSRIYDMGFDSYKSIRPRFYATFWPATNQVTVRYIGENSNSENLEDVMLDLTLTAGSASPQTVYTKSTVIDYAATRWTRVAWLGGTPQKMINIDNNLAYLAATMLFPNYDTSNRPSEDTLVNVYHGWATYPHDVYDNGGTWIKYMGTTGQTAGPAVGPYPQWISLWLYTGDWRMRDMSLGAADLAGAWPNHVREGQSTRTFISGTNALGKPISVIARPNIRLFDTRYTDADQITIKGTQITNYPLNDPAYWGGWMRDAAHEPDPFSAPYALTGDYFYLEQMNLWGSADEIYHGPEYRGATGSGWGGIHDQPRGEAWMLRNLVAAAMLNPDGSPEKTYFTQMTNDAIAIWEGQRGVTGTAFTNSPQWQWGASTIGWLIFPSALHTWRMSYPAIPSDQGGYIGGDATADTILWMDSMVIYSLGLAKERGFATEGLLKFMAPLLVGQFNDPGYDPRLMASYVTPMGDPINGLYTRWSQVQAKLRPDAIDATFNYFAPGVVNTYGFVLSTAASMMTNESGMAPVWNWLVTNVRNQTDYTAYGYAWDILPRSVSTSPYVSLFASPTVVTSGGSATLSWSSSNVTSCTGSGFTASATSGSVTVNPSVTTTYSITCTGSLGSATSQTTVTVQAQGAPTAFISASPTSITVGQNSTLTWSSANATSCTGTGFSTGSAVAGSVTVTPSATTNYSVTCTGPGGTSAPATATVTVGSATATASLTASPTSINAGEYSTLTWSSTNATSCTGTGFSTGSAVSGQDIVSPSVTTTYSINCSGATASATVTVGSAPPPPPPPPPGTASINFQPASSPVPSGYQMADESVFSSALGYGWDTPVESRDRDLITDQVLDTFVFTQPGVTASWNYSIPNGDYLVSLASGDAYQYILGPHRVMVEGQTVINDVTAAPGQFITRTDVPVTVSDGSLTVTIGGTTGYTMLNYIVIKPATVTLPVPTASLAASPASITVGESSTLTWSSTNATSCTGSGFSTGGALFGSVSVTPSATASYSVTCTGPGGTSSPASATVTVSSATPPTAFLSASPASITVGQSSMLTWSSANATSCTGSGFSTGSAISGSVSVTPSATTNYSVTCTGPGGGASASASVTVSAITSAFKVGARVTTTAPLNVRNKANTNSGKILCTQPVGAHGTIIAGPTTQQGYIWWNVNFDTSCDGYAVQTYMVTP